jgi:hypothetical protein
MKVINNNFPSSKLEMPVFFTDVFDLGKPWDKTRAVATKIV